MAASNKNNEENEQSYLSSPVNHDIHPRRKLANCDKSGYNLLDMPTKSMLDDLQNFDLYSLYTQYPSTSNTRTEEEAVPNNLTEDVVPNYLEKNHLDRSADPWFGNLTQSEGSDNEILGHRIPNIDSSFYYDSPIELEDDSAAIDRTLSLLDQNMTRTDPNQNFSLTTEPTSSSKTEHLKENVVVTTEAVIRNLSETICTIAQDKSSASTNVTPCGYSYGESKNEYELKFNFGLTALNQDSVRKAIECFNNIPSLPRLENNEVIMVVTQACLDPVDGFERHEYHHTTPDSRGYCYSISPKETSLPVATFFNVEPKKSNAKDNSLESGNCRDKKLNTNRKSSRKAHHDCSRNHNKKQKSPQLQKRYKFVCWFCDKEFRPKSHSVLHNEIRKNPDFVYNCQRCRRKLASYRGERFLSKIDTRNENESNANGSVTVQNSTSSENNTDSTRKRGEIGRDRKKGESLSKKNGTSNSKDKNEMNKSRKYRKKSMNEIIRNDSKLTLMSPNCPEGKPSPVYSDNNRNNPLEDNTLVTDISSNHHVINPQLHKTIFSPKTSQTVNSEPDSNFTTNFSEASQGSSIDHKFEALLGNVPEEKPYDSPPFNLSMPLIDIPNCSFNGEQLSSDHSVTPFESATQPAQQPISRSARKEKLPRIYCTKYRGEEIKEKEFRYCPKCEYKCKTSSDLTKHVIRRHTRNFKYCCIFCQRGFITPKELNLHIQRIHKKFYPFLSNKLRKK